VAGEGSKSIDHVLGDEPVAARSGTLPDSDPVEITEV
jgi:hypothetical protein